MLAENGTYVRWNQVSCASYSGTIWGAARRTLRTVALICGCKLDIAVMTLIASDVSVQRATLWMSEPAVEWLAIR